MPLKIAVILFHQLYDAQKYICWDLQYQTWLTHTHTNRRRHCQSLGNTHTRTHKNTDICRHALDGKGVILYYLLNPLQSIYVENCFISLHISQSTSSSLLYPCDCASVCVCVCENVEALTGRKKRKFKYVGIIVEEKIFLVASHSLGKLNQETPKVVDIFRPQDLPPPNPPSPAESPPSTIWRRKGCVQQFMWFFAKCQWQIRKY